MDLEILNIPAYQRIKQIKSTSKQTLKPLKNTRQRPELKFEEINILETNKIHTDYSENNLKKSTATKEYKIAGSVEGYFEKIDVAIIKVTSALKIGDKILIENTDGLFEHRISSMQIERKEVKVARIGSSIGLKISKKPKVGGQIYKSL